ncbi:MAG: S1 family peptidase [Trueperaceae bacterium]
MKDLRMLLSTLTVVSVLVLTSCSQSVQPEATETIEEQIYGGEEAAASQFPWVSELRVNNSFTCGSSILSAEWALTAEHCVNYSTRNPGRYRVVAGQYARGIDDGTEQASYVSQILLQPNGADVALLRLEDPLTLNNAIQPIAVASPPAVGSTVRQAGWGETEDGDAAITLKYYDTTITEISSLEIATQGDFVNGIYEQSCFGDSGSGLTYNNGSQWTVIGVASYVSNERCNDGFVGWGRVDVNWINDTIGN